MNRRSLFKMLFGVSLAATIEEEKLVFACMKKTPELAGKVRVFCNGVEIDHAIRADVKNDECERYVFRNGLPVLTSDRTAVKREILKGNIRIEWKL